MALLRTEMKVFVENFSFDTQQHIRVLVSCWSEILLWLSHGKYTNKKQEHVCVAVALEMV